MFLRNRLPLRTSLLCFRRLASSVTESKKFPDLYNGIFTKFGWVLVKKTHVSRGWTQGEINSALTKKLGSPSQNLEYGTVQEAVDEWAASADLKKMPKPKKKTAADTKSENDIKLYLQQSRYTDTSYEPDAASLSKTEPKQFKATRIDTITFTNAWNYFMTVSYGKYKDLPSKEARKKVGIEWRSLKMDEKEFYRQEYTRLLESGKDILHGKIVDREVKLRASEKSFQAKERVRIKKLKALQDTETMADPNSESS